MKKLYLVLLIAKTDKFAYTSKNKFDRIASTSQSYKIIFASIVEALVNRKLWI